MTTSMTTTRTAIMSGDDEAWFPGPFGPLYERPPVRGRGNDEEDLESAGRNLMAESNAFRILVTGSRDWTDENLIAGALLHEVSRRPSSETITVVHGAARGADKVAARVAVHYGWQAEAHPADWDGYGKSAGFIRNAEMVALGADVCLAFYKQGAGNKGTDHCASQAGNAGIPVRRFTA